MPVDLGEFEASVTSNGPRCWYRVRDFSPEQRAKVDAALARRDITAAAIARVVRSWGFKLGEQAVSRHRSGGCHCD